jgi:DNA recombination protein Rad52
MPGPGKGDYVRHIWSNQERQQIIEKLNRQLGPEYISYRQAAGSLRVAYLEGWKVVQLANDVFGFNGWNSEIKDITVDYCDEVHGRYNVGLSCIVRVVLQDGTYHEDIGYGHVENARSKCQAYEKCKKEATTDGLKRALRLFGNALGNCLYDQQYAKNVSKMKTEKPKFDPTKLLRRPEFSEDPAEVHHKRIGGEAQLPTTVSAPPVRVVVEGDANGFDDLMSDELDEFEIDFIDGLPRHIETPVELNDETSGNGASNPKATPGKPLAAGSGPAGFVSARAAEAIQSNSPLPSGSQFDPTFQSPIAKNIPQDKSRPIKRSQLSTPRVGAPPILRYTTPLQDKGANAVNTASRRPGDGDDADLAKRQKVEA